MGIFGKSTDEEVRLLHERAKYVEVDMTMTQTVTSCDAYGNPMVVTQTVNTKGMRHASGNAGALIDAALQNMIGSHAVALNNHHRRVAELSQSVSEQPLRLPNSDSQNRR